jgi:hypothetical protein
MEMKAVESKMFSAVGYDSETQTLQVRFANGGTYAYLDVPETVYQELMAAESKGKFFAVRIKNQFRTNKVS